jgi:hypothetical protein
MNRNTSRYLTRWRPSPSFQKGLLHTCNYILLVCGLLIPLTLFVIANFADEAQQYSGIFHWDTSAHYVIQMLFFAVLYGVLSLQQERLWLQWAWLALALGYIFRLADTCIALAIKVDYNSAYINNTLAYAFSAIVAALLLVKMNGEATAYRLERRLLPVLKVVLIVLFFGCFVFVYDLMDTRAFPPVHNWDIAVAYLSDALLLVAAFTALLLLGDTTFHRRTWGVLAAFCTLRVLTLLYAIIFGAPTVLRVGFALVFYVTLAIVIFLSIHRQQPKLK